MKAQLKKEAYTFCQEQLRLKRERIENEIRKIRESLLSETKSSAGDKHETGRAMMQLEREKLGKQLLEAEKMQQVLNRIDINTSSQKIRLGSLVETDLNTYFIATAAGNFQVDGKLIFCISANAPIARHLLGKSTGETITLNNVQQQIIGVA